MGLKLVKRINYFKPGGSFENSYLGQLVTADLRKTKAVANESANRVVSNVRKTKETINDRDKRRKWAELRARNRKGILNDTARIQDELFKGGFYGNGVTYKLAVDGIWGKATLDAYNRRKLASISTQDSEKSKQTIKIINKEEAKNLYKNGTGATDAYSAALYHLMAPESYGIPHSSSLKDQIAAEIAYTEGIPIEERDKTNKPIKGTTYIGYKTHGQLSDLSENVNAQVMKNNGTGKVMGGYRYKVNPDGSVDVIDKYSFDTVRDFTRKNKHGHPYVYTKGEDPYSGHEWQGLWHDVTTPGEGKTIQNIAENFLSRQGKMRENNIHFEPGEINTRNSK